jgi:hypothetical protein
MLGIIDSGQKIITTGLALHWDAGQRRSYPTSGTTWSDISGNNKNGTITNGPTFNSSNGGSIAFDGLNDYVSIGVGSGVNQLGTGNFTITGWFRRPNTGIFAGNIIGDYYTGGVETNGEWQVLAGSNNNTGTTTIYVYRAGFSGWVYLNQTTGFATDTWVNFALSRIGSTITLYANGGAVGSTVTDSGTWGTATGNLNVGIDGDNASEGFNGRLATIMVYKGKGLTSTEVLQNYNALKSRFGL